MYIQTKIKKVQSLDNSIDFTPCIVIYVYVIALCYAVCAVLSDL